MGNINPLCDRFKKIGVALGNINPLCDRFGKIAAASGNIIRFYDRFKKNGAASGNIAFSFTILEENLKNILAQLETLQILFLNVHPS
ncbi:hypothetical protein [Neobacillus cucumis]|uniref:hypothetical protein n=1 Tax=Neobacillus cucumis TaxID=1740721 RepID=UPI0019642A49|nr:hypothetical protein [Neobacillus cucumis]MBM7656392.1 hypothetical protein [Neobacillus cucumis]